MLVDNETKQSVHNDLGMFVLVLMTHGSLGAFSGSDGKAMSLLNIYKLLSAEHFPAMAGKPKLLVFQICSGCNEFNCFYIS